MDKQNAWHIVNWTNQLAIHQSALTRALGEMGWHVTIVAAEAVSPDRRKLGWQVPDFGESRIVLNPSFQEVDSLLLEKPEETIHILGAALQYRWGNYALFRASQHNCMMGLMSEASDPDGWKAPFRWIKHSTRRFLFGRKLQFVLAMGRLGVEWFRKCGYPSERIFPFMYVVESPLPQIVESDAEYFTVLYVGQLIPLKRVDLLIEAFANLSSTSARLVIVGDGPERPSLERLAQQLGVQNQVIWCGALPYLDVRFWMAQADVLVLPSRYDGWGAVVSEALLCGTPVICTDHCGASDLLREPWRGEVVPRNDVSALARTLDTRFKMGQVDSELRRRIRHWAQCLTAQSAAQYLSAVFDHVYAGSDRPVPPWYSS